MFLTSHRIIPHQKPHRDRPQSLSVLVTPRCAFCCCVLILVLCPLMLCHPSLPHSAFNIQYRCSIYLSCLRVFVLTTLSLTRSSLHPSFVGKIPSSTPRSPPANSPSIYSLSFAPPDIIPRKFIDVID